MPRNIGAQKKEFAVILFSAPVSTSQQNSRNSCSDITYRYIIHVFNTQTCQLRCNTST